MYKIIFLHLYIHFVIQFYMVINRIYVRQLNRFFKSMHDFCDKNGIAYDFPTFLFYNKNEICSPAYRFLYICPKPYLANSIAFSKYYKTLDKDFRDDIMDEDVYNNTIKWLSNNEKLKNLLKKIMGNDSLL